MHCFGKEQHKDRRPGAREIKPRLKKKKRIGFRCRKHLPEKASCGRSGQCRSALLKHSNNISDLGLSYIFIKLFGERVKTMFTCSRPFACKITKAWRCMVLVKKAEKSAGTEKDMTFIRSVIGCFLHGFRVE